MALPRAQAAKADSLQVEMAWAQALRRLTLRPVSIFKHRLLCVRHIKRAEAKRRPKFHLIDHLTHGLL
jgi:hypothetical protein